MQKQDKDTIKHVSIIMGGNRNWALERNLSVSEGCKHGYLKMFKVPKWFFEQGIETVSVLAFSGKDWERSQEEINRMMKLFKEIILKQQEKIIDKKWRIIFSGKIDQLPGDLPEICTDLMNRSKNGTTGTLNIYLNYSGREEILEAVRKMLKNNIDPEQIHEGMIRKYIYNGGIDDPDLIIRTGGEKCLEGFQLWQSINSKVIFINKDWPDFEEEDVGKILNNSGK